MVCPLITALLHPGVGSRHPVNIREDVQDIVDNGIRRYQPESLDVTTGNAEVETETPGTAEYRKSGVARCIPVALTYRYRSDRLTSAMYGDEILRGLENDEARRTWPNRDANEKQLIGVTGSFPWCWNHGHYRTDCLEVCRQRGWEEPDCAATCIEVIRAAR